MAGLSFVILDSNEALAIRRDDDAADGAEVRSLERELPYNAVAGDARHGTVGQANGEACAIGQWRNASRRQRHTTSPFFRRMDKPHGRSFFGDGDFIAIRR